MLISAPLASHDIACVRLVTGEEVVARIVSIDTGSLTITKPILLQMHADPQSGQVVGVGFGPFMVGVAEDAKFTIKREHMLVQPMKARQDIADRYQQMTSPIEMPKKPGLVL